MGVFSKFFCIKNDIDTDSDDSSGDECKDRSSSKLSHVGTAAYEILRTKHKQHHHKLWNVTKARMVGDLQFTPRDAFTRQMSVDPKEGHDDWFPERCRDMIGRTTSWCDVMSLAPPDGRFMVAFKEALAMICEQWGEEDVSLDRRVTIRMMFGNIVGMPVNCTKLIKKLTKDLPEGTGSKIQLWVGSWRKDVSWNHAKIIAVDGKHLWTGGHNFWDDHYLKNDPVNDLSLEMEGGVAKDAHRFANQQWGYIAKKQATAWGRFVDRKLSDAMDVPRRARVTVSNYPEGTTAEFPPYYKTNRRTAGLRRLPSAQQQYVPVITMGRYGTLLRKDRPSDDAFVAMLDSAQTIIRMALQDLGPVALPGTKQAVPGMGWPKTYLDALARVIWTRGVDVEIVLSNPGSIPGSLSMLEACYGNGWSCVDVASEIIKRIQKQFPSAPDGDLRQKVEENLRISFLRSPKGGRYYKDGQTLGLHSKHFIVDDICCYIGSQNFYICDLAEWGVVIDDKETVETIKAQYWDPMWKTSWVADDCDVQAVMDGLKINRDAPNKVDMTKIQFQQMKEKLRASTNVPSHFEQRAKRVKGDDSS